MNPQRWRRPGGGWLARPLRRRAIAIGTAGALALAGLTLGLRLAGSSSAGDASWERGADVGGASSSAPPNAPPNAPPTRLRIASIAVDTPLEDLDLDPAGALRAPKDFAHAGWYAKGNRPGDVGPAVIAGHVDSKRGPAVFDRLDELRPGEQVEVMRGGTWVTFRVLATRRYPKAKFPTDEVYAPTPNAQLRLITCGGAFDQSRGSYLDNIVVYAVLVA
jgi:hypothetical protein